MLRFVSVLAILAATAKAAPVAPAHYSYVAAHPQHYEVAPQHGYYHGAPIASIPEVQYPIHIVESHEQHLPQKYVVESHDVHHGQQHHAVAAPVYVDHSSDVYSSQGGYSSLYGGASHGHLYNEGGAYGGYANKYNDYYAYPKYNFEYGVNDPHTGDHKAQWEERDGDVVKGGYMLKEADGTTRVVEYTADDHNGFNAVVKKIGHAHHPETYHQQPQYAHHAAAVVPQQSVYGGFGNYAGAYATGDYYGKGATSYAKVWKQE